MHAITRIHIRADQFKSRQ